MKYGGCLGAAVLLSQMPIGECPSVRLTEPSDTGLANGCIGHMQLPLLCRAEFPNLLCFHTLPKHSCACCCNGAGSVLLTCWLAAMHCKAAVSDQIAAKQCVCCQLAMPRGTMAGHPSTPPHWCWQLKSLAHCQRTCLAKQQGWQAAGGYGKG